MPRILPRLLNALAQAQHKPPAPARPPPDAYKRRLRASLLKPLPPTPSFYPSGRSQSVLLDDVNPTSQPHNFRRHKAQPSRIRLFKHERKQHLVKGKAHNKHDLPRRMTPEERRWYANPYLRMLASPVRKCILTGRFLPADLLIRLTTVRPSSAHLSAKEFGIVVPDGLTHPKWRARRAGKGYYMLCWQAAVEQLKARSSEFIRYGAAHAQLAAQIGHLLRTRVLHELELLAQDLSHRPRDAASAPVLRRLTRAEFANIRGGTSPLPKGTLALLVVPPVNRDPKTKTRLLLHVGETPPPPEDVPMPRRPPLPLSVLLPVSPDVNLGDGSSAGLSAHAEHRAPLYNGTTLFPSRTQRAALHKALCDVLLVERRARWREEGTSKSSPEKGDKWARGEAKASHAFVLCSNAKSIMRSDAVPLSIALWRLRMWEDDGWERTTEPWERSTLP